MNAMANGVVGGITSVLQGGKFGHGFASAGLSAFAKPSIRSTFGIEKNMMPARVVARAVIGGTISQVTGGKFANGAATAAFSQLFNEEFTLARARAERAAHRMASIKRLYGDILTAGNIDLDANMKLAASMSIDELGAALIDKEVWNYMRNSLLVAALKSAGNYDASLLAEFGNFHAGMTYGAAGIRLDFALLAGGGYQSFVQNIKGGNFSIGAAASSVAGFSGWMTGTTASTRSTLDWAAGGFTWGDNNDDIWPIIQGYCTTNSTCD